jgi:hypothetical protein
MIWYDIISKNKWYFQCLCNGLQLKRSYMALHDHLVCVTAIYFAIMWKLPVTWCNFHGLTDIYMVEIPRNITISEINTRRFINMYEMVWDAYGSIKIESILKKIIDLLGLVSQLFCISVSIVP